MASTFTSTYTDKGDALELKLEVPLREGADGKPTQEAAGPLKITLRNTSNGCKVEISEGSKAHHDVMAMIENGELAGAKAGEVLERDVNVVSNSGIFFGFGAAGSYSRQRTPAVLLAGDLSPLAPLVKDCSAKGR